METIQYVVLFLVSTILIVAEGATIELRHYPSGSFCTDDTGKLCTNVGDCIGGYCVCRVPFYGTYCEHRMYGLCLATRDCVRCRVLGTGALNESQCHECTSSSGIIDTITPVDYLDEDAWADDDRVGICDYCRFKYVMYISPTMGNRLDLQVIQSNCSWDWSW